MPKTIDARGMLCPRPVMLAQQALAEASDGDILEVLLDNAIACENVSRFLRGNGAKVNAETEGDLYRVKAVIAVNNELCPTCTSMYAEEKPAAVAITHAGMGHGSDELGRILMQACINALSSIEPQPSAIVFYNSGVELACAGSPVLPALADLEKKGVKILVCGTCLDYFSLTDKCKVGIISNMFEVLSTLANAKHVINP